MSLHTIGIVAALHKRRALETARSIVQFWERSGRRALVTPECAVRLKRPQLAAELPEVAATDLAIVLGGDGSVLATARAAAPHNTPILAVYLGGFGFLNDINASDLPAALERVLRSDFHVESRLMLQATVLRDGAPGETCIGLNDAVITKGAFSRLMHLRTSVNGQFVAAYPADGMIVATPTGSTAYSLSAGGPIVPWDVEVFILTPICAHSLFTRPLLVSADDEVRILIRWQQKQSEEVMLTVDGQVGIWLRSGDEIAVRRAPYPARLVRLTDDTFYEKLRSKLHWGGEL